MSLRDGLFAEREHETDDGEIITWTEAIVHLTGKASWQISGRERTIRKKHGIGLATVTEAKQRQKALEEMVGDEA